MSVFVYSSSPPPISLASQRSGLLQQLLWQSPSPPKSTPSQQQPEQDLQQVVQLLVLLLEEAQPELWALLQVLPLESSQQSSHLVFPSLRELSLEVALAQQLEAVLAPWVVVWLAMEALLTVMPSHNAPRHWAAKCKKSRTKACTSW